MDGWLPALKALLLSALSSWVSGTLQASLAEPGRRLRSALAHEAQRLWDVVLCTGLALLAGVLGITALGTAAWMVTPEPWRPTLLGAGGLVLCSTGAGLARAARRRLSATVVARPPSPLSAPRHPAAGSVGRP